MERIELAALQLDNDIIFVSKPNQRHSDIYEELHKLNIPSSRVKREGFVTDSVRFVNRKEAKRIAVKANQLIVPLEETYDELYSEDVW